MAVVQQQKVLAEATAAAKRLSERYERTSAAWQVAAHTRTAVEAWLKDRPGGTTVEDWVGPDPKPNKGEDILAARARLERRCRELRADAHRVASTPFPSSHAKQRMREIVQCWARAGAPNVSALIEHEHGEISWPTRTSQSTVFNAEGPRPVAFAEVTDLIATLSWLLPDAMVKRLDAMLAEEADDASVLAIPDRQGQALQIQSDLLPPSVTWPGLCGVGSRKGCPCGFRKVLAQLRFWVRTRDAPGGRRRRNKPRACD